MHELAPLIKDLAVMLGVASLVTLLFQKIRQPVVLGYLIAGIIIGPYTPPHAFVTDIPNIETLSELGVIFLMFSLGLDFSFHKLARVGSSASITGFLEVLLMFGVGFLVGHWIGWSFYNCLFLGAALAISSTTIIIKALEELNLKRKRFAELVFGILVVEDLLAILLLVALSVVVSANNIFSMTVVWAALKLFVVVGGWFLVGYFLIPTFMRKVMHIVSEETLTIISIALCLLLVYVATYFHYSAALGAFIMGSILAETPLIHRIETLIRPIRDIFAAIFFISVGMLIDPRIILEQFPLILLICVATIFGKVFITGMGALLTGQSLTTSLRVGFSMAQVGEFSFIIIALGTSLKVISPSLYPIIVAVSAITTFTTPYLIQASGIISQTLEKKLPPKTKYLLENYSRWIYRLQAYQQEKSRYREYFIRLILNGIIVAIIFTLSQQLILPEILDYTEKDALAKIMTWLITLIISSPFLWGMLFSLKTPKKTFLNPLLVLGWGFTFLEIAVFSLAYFFTWVIALLLAVFTAFLFSFSHSQLEKSYQWFEQKLIRNINKRGHREARYEALGPWDTHLIEMQVSEDSFLCEKPLSESQLRQRFGINIVAIQRGKKIIPAPRGQAKIMPYDKLIILGNDEQIEECRPLIETPSLSFEDDADHLADFGLTTLFIHDDHSLKGKTIRDSRLREKILGLVVGLERDNQQILNPDPATVIQAKDILTLVGKVEQFEKLH